MQRFHGWMDELVDGWMEDEWMDMWIEGSMEFVTGFYLKTQRRFHHSHNFESHGL